jgi:hypothetical protein
MFQTDYGIIDATIDITEIRRLPMPRPMATDIVMIMASISCLIVE